MAAAVVGGRALFVLVVQARPVEPLAVQIGHAVPTLATTEGGEVEEMEAAHQHLQAARVAGIGVEHLPTVAQEHADAGLLALDVIGQPQTFQLLLVAVVPRELGPGCGAGGR